MKGDRVIEETRPMAELSRDDVTEVLGPVSDPLAAEIIATGIDRAGLVAARDRVLRDRKTHRHDIPVDQGPFGEVVDILERARGRRGRLHARIGAKLGCTSPSVRRSGRAAIAARAGIHTRGQWLWILGSRLRRAPE